MPMPGQSQPNSGHQKKPRKKRVLPKRNMPSDVSPELWDAIERIVEDKPTVRGTECQQLLTRQAHLQGKVPSGSAGAKQLNRWLARYFAPPDAPWQLANAEPDEAALVLPVLATTALRIGPATIPRNQAGLIVKIRSAAPSIPPHWAGHLAWKYVQRDAALGADGPAWSHPAPDIDLLLAMEPWASRDAYDRFTALLLHAIPDDKSAPWPGALIDAARMEAERSGQPLAEVLSSLRTLAAELRDLEKLQGRSSAVP
jgi:hypothetical protein